VRDVGTKDWMSGEERKGETSVLIVVDDIVLLCWVSAGVRVIGIDGCNGVDDEALCG
jgi:hypothetical protein